MNRNIPVERGATVSRKGQRRFVVLGLLAVMLAGVWRFVIVPGDDPPIRLVDFASPLASEEWYSGAVEHRKHFYSERPTLLGAVAEYAELTHRSFESPVSLRFNELDATCHGWLTRLRLRRLMDRLSRIELPPGRLALQRDVSDPGVPIESKPFDAGLSLASPAAGMSIAQMNGSGSSTGVREVFTPPPGFIETTPSERVVQLWTALRNQGVELKPLGDRRLKVVWHRRILEDGVPERR